MPYRADFSKTFGVQNYFNSLQGSFSLRFTDTLVLNYHPISLIPSRFDVLRSVVFFYIKSPLRVEEAGLQELIPTTWWPNRFNKEVKNIILQVVDSGNDTVVLTPVIQTLSRYILNIIKLYR